MKIKFNNNEYTYLISYQNEDKYRFAFNELVKKTYRFSFEEWYQAGYWNEKYIPYTLFDGEKAISNVSVNIMDFNVSGKHQRYIQLGTVITDNDYRNKHLNKFLMQKILEELNDKCDLIYLYANKSVLDMYPKYGLKQVKEYEYFKSIKNHEKHPHFEKLNMDMQSNRDMLYDYVKNSRVYAKFAMNENADLIMCNCILFLKEKVYYNRFLDTIVIVTFHDNQLRLWDVFSKANIDLDDIIHSSINPQIDTVILGFTPDNSNSYEIRVISGDDTLFIQQGKTDIFDEKKIMFPLLSHA